MHIIYTVNCQGHLELGIWCRSHQKAIKNRQCRENGNIGYTRRRKTKQKHNTICNGHNPTQTNTNNLNKTRALLHTTNTMQYINRTYHDLSSYLLNYSYANDKKGTIVLRIKKWRSFTNMLHILSELYSIKTLFQLYMKTTFYNSAGLSTYRAVFIYTDDDSHGFLYMTRWSRNGIQILKMT